MNKYSKTERWMFIVVGAFIAFVLYIVIVTGFWRDAEDWRMEPACPFLCMQSERERRDHAVEIQKAFEPVTKSSSPSSQGEREKYRKRNLYRERNLIGWT